MRSHEKVDSEQRAYVQAANKHLAALSHAGYQWWDYSISHRMFQLLVGDAAAKERNVVISLAGCEHLSGPVYRLEGHGLEVIFLCDRAKREPWEFIVQSEAAGFRAAAGTFTWHANFDLLNRRGTK